MGSGEAARLAGWVEGWAAPGGIPVLRGGAPPPGPSATPSNRVAVVNLDPRTDFGRVAYRTPACVLEPRTRAELAGCVARLAEARVPFKVRGYAHSAGGQVLSDGGVVIGTRRLRGIAPAGGDRFWVEGGTPWSEVVRHLRPRGLRPPVLTGNLLTSVAGTLSAGGVGSTSFVHGMQVAAVERLVLVLATGETVCVGPGDELHRHALAGAGQFGVIAAAELRTVRRPSGVVVRHLQWPTLREFYEGAVRIRQTGRFEVMGARIYYGGAMQVYASVGVFGDVRRPADEPPPAPPRAEVWEEDHIPDERTAPQATAEGASPALVFALPVPAAFDVWNEIEAELVRAGISAYLRTGSAVTLLRNDRRFPLAPFPAGDECLFIGVRPEVPRRELERVLPVLQRAADRVLDAGGKLDLTSIRPPGDFLRRQLGAALGPLRAFKARVDPHGLLNRGLLVPEEAAEARAQPALLAEAAR